MASTYVNDLRLNEMATGDASGSWGTITNTNLELIGEAFSYGTESIGNADTTITMADGAADAARSFYLKITSSADLTTTRVITLAPNTVSKVWMIENATSGSQIITIKQGTGATINIANGQVKMIATDGAGSGGAVLDLLIDVNLAGTTVVDDLTVSDDLTVTGDIDVDGTTNLDVVDIDGAVNMATTALVTGVLTTTAAAVFNGGFASNANSTIGGNLALSAANPNIDVTDTGTGFASQDFLTNSNAARTTIGVERAAGGGLFVGSSGYASVFGSAGAHSTQIATNNNVRMTIDSAGKVGIGDPAPSEKLNVAGNIMLEGGDQYIYLTNVGTGNSGIYIRGNTAGSYLRSHSTGKFTWEAAGTERMELSSSGQLKATAGAVSAPTYSFVGDTDTGISRPTTNAVNIVTAGEERMRIDSAGKVGIGTSVAPAQKLTVTGVSGANVGGLTNGILALTTGTGAIADTRVLFGIVDDDYGWLQVADHGVAYRDFIINPNGGNVGIGTSSPDGQLHLFTSDASITPDADADDFIIEANGAAGITIGSSASSVGSIRFADSGSPRAGMIYYDHVGNAMRFYTIAAERMRIDSSGNVLVGHTNSDNTRLSVEAQTNGSAVMFRRNTATYSSSAVVGSIACDSSSTTYATSSDYRLKENVDYTWDATTRLKQLKPARFNFIVDDTNTLVDGFLAHEVSSIVPESITGTKDAVDADNNPVYQGIDQSKLVPLLVKTIQELEARITALEG